MIFSHLAGLFGLLALPAILVLHYFRSQRKTYRVGGLHLWDFAKRQLPVGKIWRRVFMTLPLALELAAALLAALLLSGLTWLREPERRHVIVALDDSASMGATDALGGSPAEKAVAWIKERADDDTRWTIVTAGLEAGILAGPYATSDQAMERLAGWRPLSTAAGLDEAARFGAKFGEPGQRPVVITDSSDGAEPLLEFAELESLGSARANNAIVFADRFRVDATTDRVFALVRRFGGDAGDEVAVTLRAGGGDIAKRLAKTEPGATTRLEFDLPSELLDLPVSLLLPGDAFALDNEAILAPTPPRRVLAHVATREPLGEYAKRALAAATETYLTENIDEAHLIVTDSIVPIAAERALTIIRFPAPVPDEELGYASENYFADRRSPLFAGATYEGLLWWFDSKHVPAPDDETLLAANRSILATREHAAESKLGGGAERYFINAVPDLGNVARATIWPILFHNAAGATRERLPGLRRSNYRAGEEIDPGLSRFAGLSEIAWTLDGPGGAKVFQGVPETLFGLEPGLYNLSHQRQDGERGGYRFAVNFFAPDESDLTRADAKQRANFRRAALSGQLRESFNPIPYYLLLALLCAVLAWRWSLDETRRAGA
jgi:hypothetical protein